MDLDNECAMLVFGNIYFIFGFIALIALSFCYAAIRYFSAMTFLILIFSGLWYHGGHFIKSNTTVVQKHFGETTDLENIFAPSAVFFSSLASLGAFAAIFFQYRQFKKQQFQSNFFALIATHRDNAKPFNDENHKNSFANEYKFMNEAYKLITNPEYESSISFTDEEQEAIALFIDLSRYTTSNQDYKKTFYSVYKHISSQETTDMDRYFHHLYHVIKFTKQNAPFLERNSYYGILRAQLSHYETALLYYTNIIEYDTNRKKTYTRKFKKLVEKTHMLHNIDEDMLFDKDMPDNKIGTYSESAFHCLPERIYAVFKKVSYEINDTFYLYSTQCQ